MLTIHSNRSFLLTDDRGDIADTRETGLYHEDTRFLCSWRLLLDGKPPLPLTAAATRPDLARSSLLALARLQGRGVDKVSGEEPGKILHEYRTGDLAGARRFIPKFPYYGTIDATPLFVIVLHEYWRWTGDRGLVETLREPLRRALAWIGDYGDRDRDGYLEYLLEAPTGLANQGWKDSGDSVRFRDGRLAEGPIALCEVQGYVYDAKVRGAELLALLGEARDAARHRSAAAELKARFNRDYWLEGRGTFALALDGRKRQVDALTSNPGHLLWSGIVAEDKAARVARSLLDPALFSGWGVRTMAAGEGGYNPVSYHNGSVWPHDNSLAAMGMARYGFHAEAARLIRAQLDAAAFYPDARLPELFAGYERERFGVPVDYPTSNRPQAWAAGAVLLFLRAMLGVIPDAAAGEGELRPFLAKGIGRLRVRGLRVGSAPRAIEVERAGSTVRARWLEQPGQP